MTRSRTIRKAFLTLGLSLSALTALGVAPAAAGPVADRVNSSGTLRVCIWPDYYGITFRDARNQQLRGVDIDLSAEFAKRLGARLQYVESSFAKLVDDVVAERCDVAMFGVGVTAQRQRSLAFSQPYLRSDVYGITTRANRVVGTWDDIDKPGVRVAVAAGTFMEPVMAQALGKATLVVLRAPQTREAELEAGRVDVFMTDYPYSRRLLENADWVRMVAPPRPFHPIPYAYAVKPGDDEWLRRVDEFVAEIKRDGTLEAAARRHGLSEIVVR
jgi:ABC-type amino acid transport substrate-binding protein